MADAIAGVLPFIKKNEDGPQSEEWQVLKIHTEYVKLFVSCLNAMERGDDEDLKKFGSQLRDLINRNEPQLQKHLDGWNAHRVLSLRTGVENMLPISLRI